MSFAQVDQADIDNLHRPLEREPDKWGMPHCGSVQTSDANPHALGHLDAIANRASLAMPLQKGLVSTLKRAFRTVLGPAGSRDLRTTVTLREAGERLRVALISSKAGWVVYELAAVYWQIRGKAPEAVDCLQKGYVSLSGDLVHSS